MLTTEQTKVFIKKEVQTSDNQATNIPVPYPQKEIPRMAFLNIYI